VLGNKNFYIFWRIFLLSIFVFTLPLKADINDHFDITPLPKQTQISKQNNDLPPPNIMPDAEETPPPNILPNTDETAELPPNILPHAEETAELPPSSVKKILKAEPPKVEDVRGYVINFDNVNIIEYLRWISDITNRNFIFNEKDLQFNITIVSKEPAAPEVIMSTLLQILKIHNLNMLEQGKNIVIYPGTGTTTTSNILYGGESPSENSAIVTKIFQLENVNPTRISGIISPLLSQNAQIEVSAETGHFIVTDVATNIAKVEELLVSLDKPNTSLDIGVYNVSSANVTTLKALAERIVGPLAEENPLILVPQSSTKTIFIISTPYLIEKTTSILKKLDNVPQDRLSASVRENDLPTMHIDRTKFQVYKLQYHQGDEIQKSLKKIGTTLAHTGVTNASLVSTINTIEWIESTNALVFSGDQESINKLEDLVKNLDVPKREVYIEMLIIETSVGNSLTFGVQGGLSNFTGNSAAGIIGMQPGKALQTAMDTVSTTPDASGLMNDKGFYVGVIGKILKHGTGDFTSLGALVNALHTDTDTTIVMNPQIVTENGSPAEFFVGQTDQFPSSEISQGQGEYIKTTYENRRIGARLRVTPTLGNSDIVTLDIDQELSASNDSEDDDTTRSIKTIFSTRSTRTRVHVPNKYFLVLSGMISETNTKTKNRLPCLGGLPIFGALAGDYKGDSKRSNLMIFIRPHIITTAEEIAKVTETQKARLDEALQHEENFEIDNLLDLLQLKED
jgi:type III secretion protein C